MKRFLKAFLALGLTAVLLSTSVYGADMSNEELQNDDLIGGAYCKDLITGETYCIPKPEIEAYSNETFGFSPGYDPFADEENNDENLIEPYYTDHGRTLVKNPQYNQKYRSTVYIETRYWDKDLDIVVTSGGTGFLIGPNAVATAGHIVYNWESNNDSHWITQATIIPAYNADSNHKPFGTAEATHFYCGWDWAKKHDSSDDWGIILLDSNIGNDVGWLGLQWQSAPYASGTAVNVNGYPDIVNGRYVLADIYTRTGTVGAAAETNTLESKDMFVSKGDSGGPCYIYSNTYGYTAIGITSMVDPTDENDREGIDISRVRFRTIDRSLYEMLIQYRSSTL